MNCTHTHLNPFTHKHTHTCRMRYTLALDFVISGFVEANASFHMMCLQLFVLHSMNTLTWTMVLNPKLALLNELRVKWHFEANGIAFNWCKKILYGLCLHRICNHEKLDQLSKYLWFLLLWKTSRLSLTQWALENHTVFISINRMREVTW